MSTIEAIVCHRNQHIVTVGIEMAVQSEFVTGDKISQPELPWTLTSCTASASIRKFYGSILIIEDLLQPVGLLSAAGVNPVETNGVSARKIINFERFTCFDLSIDATPFRLEPTP